MFGRLCGLVYFKILGWKLSGPHPNDVPRKVIIVVPHTSGWDFPLGLLIKYYWKLRITFVGKKSLFKWPLNQFFRMFGIIPIDRKSGQSAVDGIVQLFNQNKLDTIGLAPEGTRKKVSKLKTGFYRIATTLDIPVIMVKFDYQNKEVSFSAPKRLNGEKEAEMKQIEDYFRGTLGKIPEFSF